MQRDPAAERRGEDDRRPSLARGKIDDTLARLEPETFAEPNEFLSAWRAPDVCLLKTTG